MTTFDTYAELPELIRNALLELESFIGDLDGVDTADDGTIDADDAVKAFNVVVAALALHQQPAAAQPVTADQRGLVPVYVKAWRTVIHVSPLARDAILASNGAVSALQRQASPYQPIETAPKGDFSFVDLWGHNIGRVPDCCWDGQDWIANGVSGKRTVVPSDFITHWADRQTPPSQVADQRDAENKS